MMVHLYNGIPLSNETEQTTDKCNNIDGSQMHCAQPKKPDTDGYPNARFHLHDILTKVNYGDRNQISGCQVLGLREEIDYKWHKGNFWPDGNVLHLDCSITVYICQTHKTAHLEMVNFTVCNIYP